MQNAAQILEEFELTAADLWAADAIIWIEGPSDVPLMEDIAANIDELKYISYRVKAMPDVLRAAGASSRNATKAMDVFESVREAISPIKVQPLFVFDGDEKTEELKARIQTATGNRARFLPVRELENLFLSPAIIYSVLSQLCIEVEHTVPTLGDIDKELEDILSQTDNLTFYSHYPDKPDKDKAVGSHILNALWLKWAETEYDKVKDGRKLANAVAQHEPERLESLRFFLRELAEMVLHSRQDQATSYAGS